MPVLISYHHLLDNLLDVLVSSFNSPIHLRSVRRGIMMFDFELFTKLLHHLVIQIRTIISDDLARDTVSTNDLILDKSDYHLSGYISIRCCFHPCSQIIGEKSRGEVCYFILFKRYLG